MRAREQEPPLKARVRQPPVCIRKLECELAAEPDAVATASHQRRT